MLGLQILNQHGFGHTSNIETRRLDLVYNPRGPTLPPSQPELEEQYRNILQSEHDISFNSLYTITNMPIKRFADDLLQQGQFAPYMSLLAQSFNPNTLESLMCRRTVSVAWDGKIYDCDFNNALNIGSKRSTGLEDTDLNIWDIRGSCPCSAVTLSSLTLCQQGAFETCKQGTFELRSIVSDVQQVPGRAVREH